MGLQFATAPAFVLNPAQRRGMRPNAMGGRPMQRRPPMEAFQPSLFPYRTMLQREVTEASPWVTRTR